MSLPALDLRGRRDRGEAVFRGFALGAGAVVLAILGLIAFTMLRKAWPALDAEGLGFLTKKRWAVADKKFGALAFLYGTAVTSTIAIVVSLPLSLGIALFVTQLAPGWLRKPIVYAVDLLAVVPSVVFGFWGIEVLSKHITGFYGFIHRSTDSIPGLKQLFGQPAGRSLFTAGIILGIMITPIVSSLAREVIDTCPSNEREGALALGATRWEMIRGVVLPHSSGGLVGAVMLGLGRAMGETIAAALVIGSSPQIVANLFGPGDSMPAVIANQWGEADGLHKSALIALAVMLFALTIIVNVVATAVVTRSRRRRAGGV